MLCGDGEDDLGPTHRHQPFRIRVLRSVLRLSFCGITLEPDSGTHIALLPRLRVKDAAHVKCQTEDIGAPVPYYSSWYAVLGVPSFST